MVSHHDDDPIHPNYDGIVFRATTDRKGIVAFPASAQRPPPFTFLPAADAEELASDLGELIDRVRGADPQSYAAEYFGTILDDLRTALDACEAAS